MKKEAKMECCATTYNIDNINWVEYIPEKIEHRYTKSKWKLCKPAHGVIHFKNGETCDINIETFNAISEKIKERYNMKNISKNLNN